MINQKCIRDNRINFEDSKITHYSSIKLDSPKFVMKYDVLVNSTGIGTLGRLAQVKHQFQNITADSHVTIIRPNLEVMDGLYFGYSIIHKEKIIESLGTGATGQTELSRDRLGAIEIAIPFLPTQRKIAAILSAYDDLIENNTRRIQILEEMAQSLYRHWFVDFKFPGHEEVQMVEMEVGLAPEGWEVVAVRDVTKYVNRGVSPKYDESSSSIVINQKCIRDNRINLELARKHSTKVSKEKFVQVGDVLVNSTGIGTLGRVAQVYEETPDCTVDSHVSIVRPDDIVSIDYFGYIMMTLQPLFDSLGVGATGQTELARSTIANAAFQLPPKDLQDQFSNIVSPMRKLTTMLLAKNKNLRQTRDLLLPKLVSGELDVSEMKFDSKEVG